MSQVVDAEKLIQFINTPHTARETTTSMEWNGVDGQRRDIIIIIIYYHFILSPLEQLNNCLFVSPIQAKIQVYCSPAPLFTFVRPGPARPPSRVSTTSSSRINHIMGLGQIIALVEGCLATA